MPTDHATRSAADRLIVALDRPTAASALSLADALAGQVRWVKVGLELFVAAGPSIVFTLRERGFRVFLDLKLHDIPNTVAAAVRSASSFGVSLMTVHAAGGRAMLLAAADAASSPDAPRLLAVTVLTSLDADDLRSIGVPDGPAVQVARLAHLAQEAGMAGMVCSAEELSTLRQSLGPQPILLVPGIRPAGAPRDDQARTATPQAALAAGATYLVVGRPITQAREPASAAAAILLQMESASAPPA